MAKNYSAKISIKDQNSVATLQKVISMTSKLKKELASVSNTPVKINAQLGSSFKNVQGQINKVAPKSKTVHFKATQDVTKTMSNVNRQVFEMNRNIKTGLSGSMKGFNSSLNATLPKLGQISNSMASLSNASRIMKGVNGVSTLKGLAGTAGIGAGVGAGVGSAAILAGRRLIGKGDRSGYYSNKKNRMPKSNFMSGVKGKNSFAEAVAGIIMPGKTSWDIESPMGKMVNRQKTNLSRRGVSNPIAKYQREALPTTKDGKISNEIVFSVNKSSIKKSMDWVASLSRKTADSASFNFSRIKMSGLVQKTSKEFNSISTQGLKAAYAVERGFAHISFTAGKIASPFVRAFSTIKRGGTASFAAINRLASSGAISSANKWGLRFGAVGSRIKSSLSNAFTRVKVASDGTASRVPRAWVSACSKIASSITKTIGGAFSKVASMASGAISAGLKAVGVAGAAAAGIGVNSMMNQEQNKISMDHFIGVGDKKSNGGVATMTPEQTSEKTSMFMDQMNALANKTPFDNEDIMSSGRRMLQVSEGDTAVAARMTKMAADMASLNPGKTAQDASEALADLANGETERMKEFGLKLSQDQLKGLIGKTGDDPLTSGEALQAMKLLTEEGGDIFKTFNGGADKIAGTLKGQWSTLWGTFKSVMANAMKPFDSMFKSAIGNAMNFLGVSVDDVTGEMSFTGMSAKIIDSFTIVASSLQKIFSGDTSQFPIITNLINSFNILKDACMPVFDILKDQFQQILSSAEESFGGIGGIVEQVATTIGNAIRGLTPILGFLAPIFTLIKDVAMAVWPVISSIIEIGSQIIKDVVSALQPVFYAVGSVVQSLGSIIAEVWPGIHDTIMSVWEKLQPVLELFGSLSTSIAEIFSVLWPPIAGVIETLWGIIGPILEGMASMLGKISGWCTTVVDGLTGVISKVKESNLNPLNWFGGKENPEKENPEKEKPDGSHAAGLNRVPRNGYRAILHEGERVLTANESRQADAGSKGSNASQDIVINVNGAEDPEKVARFIVSELKKAKENLKLA